MEETLRFLMHGSNGANQQALGIHLSEAGRHHCIAHLNISVQVDVAQLTETPGLPDHNPTRSGPLNERIHGATPIGQQEHRGIVRCHLDRASHQSLMGGHRDVLPETIPTALVNCNHF